MQRFLVLVALATGLIPHAYAQTYPGQFPANTVYGNSGGSTAAPTPGQVVNTQLSNMATHTAKCNSTSGAGSPQDCNYPVFNVKDPAYGALCNGSNDDSTAINAAATAANTAGGGIVLFPNGVCIGENIVIYPNTIYQGQGRGATTIRGAAGTTTAVFITQNFATLTGTNTYAGPSKWSLRDMTVDGNLRTGTADDIDIYGPDYILENIDVINSNGRGIYSEFAVVAGSCPTLSACLESRWVNVKVANCSETGIQFFGPHDTQFTNILVFNTNNINSSSFAGFFIGQSATASAVASVLHDVHVYGNNGWGIIVQTPIYISGVQAENNNLTGTITGGGMIVNNTNGWVRGHGFYAFGNVGTGLSLQTTGSQISTINSSGNTGVSSDGVYVNAGSNVLSNVIANSNGRDGLFLDTSAGANTIDGIQLFSNTANGIFWGSGVNNTQVINAQTFSNVNGVNFGGSAQQVILTGSLNQDTTIGLNLGTSVTKSIIDIIVNKGAGSSWSGTIATNSVRIVSTGNDSVSTIAPTNTVANLPTCNAALQGAVSYVTNNNTATAFLGATTTGGATITPVFCNGSAWVQG